MKYAAQELHEQLKRGPHEGEDFFRLQVTGKGASRWVNITPEMLVGIIEVLSMKPEAS